MKQRTRRRSGEGRNSQAFWPNIVMRKWLNITTKDYDFSSDEAVEDTESEFDRGEIFESEQERHDASRRMDRSLSAASTSGNAPYTMHRRRKSETLRTQYIDTKELRICVGTWNVGAKLPSDDLEIEEWLDTQEPADIYVIGFQEIVQLNAGNVLGAEDNRPVPRWESLIRDTLNRVQPGDRNFKCHSHPPSPSKFKPSDDAPAIEELFSDTDSGGEDETHLLDDQSFDFPFDDDMHIKSRDESESIQAPTFMTNGDTNVTTKLDQHMTSPSQKRLARLNHYTLADFEIKPEVLEILQNSMLQISVTNPESIELSWPEKPLDLPCQAPTLGSNSFKSMRSFRPLNSFRTILEETKGSLSSLVPELQKLDSIIYRKKTSPFVKIISKQMVGIFLSVWVRRSLRKHIQNVKVSTVGVGVMGYIGNKGSISVSMSIYQTLFCFICSHLSAGEKGGDELRRNADVREIHRRTLFNGFPGITLPRTIKDHERIIWLGDLNYRINFPYDKTRELISKHEWSKLAERDQLTRELKKDRAFDGWTEGALNFPPTYKYEVDSKKYVGDDPKVGRRTPAWCDRILSFGKGLRLLNYKRSNLTLSDHRPMTATYMAEVEVFCQRKLQRALIHRCRDRRL